MTRTTVSVPRKSRHKKVLSRAKGYYSRRKKNYRVAKQAVERSMCYSYRDRKKRRGQFRSLWIQRINAALRAQGLKYSIFMDSLKKSGMDINRKMLAEMAVENREIFNNLVKQVVK